jgi:predicted NAD/FAD-binding protein
LPSDRWLGSKSRGARAVESHISPKTSEIWGTQGRDWTKRTRRILMSFTWQSAGHAFASLFKDVVTVSKKVVSALGGIQNEEKLIESLTSLVSPQAAAVEQIAFGALGELVAAVQAVETAAGANGVNVSFDASVVAEVRKLITDFPEVLAQVEAAFGKSK